jgi:hypothetical protein
LLFILEGPISAQRQTVEMGCHPANCTNNTKIIPGA